MRFYNKFIIISAIISISLFTVGAIWEITFAKYFGLLSLGYPIGYLVGLFIKSDIKPKISLSSNPYRVCFFVIILILSTFVLMFVHNSDFLMWQKNIFIIGLLGVIITAFFTTLFKKK